VVISALMDKLMINKIIVSKNCDFMPFSENERQGLFIRKD